MSLTMNTCGICCNPTDSVGLRRPSRRGAAVSLAISLLALGGCSDQPEAPIDLLFEGDSDVELWDTSGYPDSHNVGVGGAVCADVLDTIDDTLQTYQPSVVVLVCGENDLWGQDVSDTFDDVSAVVERIQDSGRKARAPASPVMLRSELECSAMPSMMTTPAPASLPPARLSLSTRRPSQPWCARGVRDAGAHSEEAG